MTLVGVWLRNILFWNGEYQPILCRVIEWVDMAHLRESTGVRFFALAMHLSDIYCSNSSAARMWCGNGAMVGEQTKAHICDIQMRTAAPLIHLMEVGCELFELDK